MKKQLFTYEIRAPKTARELFVVRPLNATPEEAPNVKAEYFKAFWPSGLSAQNKPDRIITLCEIVVDDTAYKCMMIFVPVDEQDAAGRSGLYLCNAVLAQDPKELISFLSAPDCIENKLPALTFTAHNGLKDFSHLSSILQNANSLDSIVSQNTLRKVYRTSPRKPAYVATNTDKDSLAITELFAFSFWLDKNLPVSTYELKARIPWGLSFLPLNTTYMVSGVIDSKKKPEKHDHPYGLNTDGKQVDKSPEKLSTYERVQKERSAGPGRLDSIQLKHDAAYSADMNQADLLLMQRSKPVGHKSNGYLFHLFFCFFAWLFSFFALLHSTNTKPAQK